MEAFFAEHGLNGKVFFRVSIFIYDTNDTVFDANFFLDIEYRWRLVEVNVYGICEHDKLRRGKSLAENLPPNRKFTATICMWYCVQADIPFRYQSSAAHEDSRWTGLYKDDQLRYYQ